MWIEWLEHKLKLIDNILNDFLVDLKSLRFQLVIVAICMNIYFFRHGATDMVMSVALGLLTIIFTYWFASKHKENEYRNKETLKSGVDPDE